MPKAKEKPEQEAAFVLADDAVASRAPVHFPNFPGVWEPGQPIAARELLDRLDSVETVKELEELISQEGHPLQATTVEAGSAPMPVPASQIPSEEQVARGQDEPPAKPEPDAEQIPAGTPASQATATAAASEEEGS